MDLVGYARMLSREDRPVFDRQVDAFKAAGYELVCGNRGSGASTDRPRLKECLGYLRKGDVLVVLDLDRLGPLAGELIRLVDELQAKGVGFRALNASFDNAKFIGRAFLQIQAAFAGMERNVIRQRVREGVAAARTSWRKGGRPRLMTPEWLRHAKHLMREELSRPTVQHRGAVGHGANRARSGQVARGRGRDRPGRAQPRLAAAARASSRTTPISWAGRRTGRPRQRRSDPAQALTLNFHLGAASGPCMVTPAPTCSANAFCLRHDPHERRGSRKTGTTSEESTGKRWRTAFSCT